MDKGVALGTVALVLSAAVGMQALLRSEVDSRPDGQPSARLLERVEGLERRLAALEDSTIVAAVGSATPIGSGGEAPIAERLRAVEDHLLVLQAKAGAGQLPPSPGGSVHVAAPTSRVKDLAPVATGALSEQVDRAVEAKVAELEAERKLKADKKPSFEAFASALELDPRQRNVVEHEVREGQRSMRALLDTPVADGQTLLEELVDVMAYGQAQHPEAGERWGAWFQRVMQETVPGTEQTYAAQAEAIKAEVHQALQRELSEEQYAEVEDWGLDPTEIKEIEGTPWSDIEPRVAERAEALRGAR